MDTEHIGLELALIVFLLVANGVFAMAEIAIVSARKTRLEIRAAAGSRGAKVALEMVNDPTRLLSTVQVGITLIGIFNGAFSGATVARVLAGYLQVVPGLAEYSHAISLVLVVSGITYLSLIIGELVPKKLALAEPEAIASAIALPMSFFAKVAMPVVKLLSISTDAVLHFMPRREQAEPPITEEEIRILLEKGTQYGSFEKTEQDLVERVFRLSDLRLGALMTPRTQIDWLDLTRTKEENFRIISASSHSRFPVAKENLDDVIGVAYSRDLLATDLRGKDLQLEAVVRTPLYVPKSMKAFKILELFKKSGMHVAFVMDEYGGFLGLLTLNDILEQIVGDMSSIFDEREPDIVEQADGSWLLDGMLPVEEVKELFGLVDLPGEERENYQTLGGFIVSYLGFIPKRTDGFEWDGLRFEVAGMDRIRVDKVLVSKLMHGEGE